MLTCFIVLQPFVRMLEDVKKSFFQVDNERRLFLGKTCFWFCAIRLSCCFEIHDSVISGTDEKNKAVQQASTLEEKMKALEKENAALKRAANAEKSQKDRLLAVVHTLTGAFNSICIHEFFWKRCS